MCPHKQSCGLKIINVRGYGYQSVTVVSVGKGYVVSIHLVCFIFIVLLFLVSVKNLNQRPMDFIKILPVSIELVHQASRVDLAA